MNLAAWLQSIFQWTNSSQRNLVLLFLVGLIGRCILFVSDGLNSDFTCFENWATQMVQHGFTSVYDTVGTKYESDYPPLYLYLLYGWGLVFHTFNLTIDSHFFDNMLKLSNLVVELVFFRYLFKKYTSTPALIFWIINPIILINAYGWGQIDLLLGILLFLSIVKLHENKLGTSALYLALAINLKSLTLIYLPLYFIFLMRSEHSIRAKLSAVGLFIIFSILPNVPFIIFHSNPYISLYPHITASGRYSYLSVNAFNIWWTAFANTFIPGEQYFPQSNLLIANKIPIKYIGFAVQAVISIGLAVKVLEKRFQITQSFAILSIYTLSFYVFLPEMHERYLFPLFIFIPFILNVYNTSTYRWMILLLTFLHAFNLIWAWGDMKYLHFELFYQIGRVFGVLTLMVLCWMYYSFKREKLL